MPKWTLPGRTPHDVSTIGGPRRKRKSHRYILNLNYSTVRLDLPQPTAKQDHAGNWTLSTQQGIGGSELRRRESTSALPTSVDEIAYSLGIFRWRRRANRTSFGAGPGPGATSLAGQISRQGPEVRSRENQKFRGEMDFGGWTDDTIFGGPFNSHG